MTPTASTTASPTRCRSSNFSVLHLSLPASLALRQSSRFASVAMLVLALLWAQTWGQRHSVVHARHAAAAASIQVPGVGHGLALGQTVVDHDAGDAQCRLLDQLSHADSLPCVPLQALPVEFSAALVAHSAGLAVARWAALFQARAPPSLR